MAWREVHEPAGFQEWVRELRGASGVYAIRSSSSGEILYVGESHSGRLYQTITRHFQVSSNGYKGPTYQRGRCEVRIEVTTPRDALDLQDEWIRRLQPRDNEMIPVDDDDEIPF